MRSRASSGVRPIAQAVISESGIGARPSRSHARASFSRRSAHSSGVAKIVLYSSAHFAAGRIVPERPLPPTIRCGCGPVAPEAAHGLRSAPRASASRVFISGNGKPNASCSASIQPVPIPSETRPAAISFAVAETFASTAAARKVTGETSVPSSSRVVCAASAAITAQASSAALLGVGLGEVVVGAEERLDAVLLARARERQPVLPGDPLLSLDHQRQAHPGILWPCVSRD